MTLALLLFVFFNGRGNDRNDGFDSGHGSPGGLDLLDFYVEISLKSETRVELPLGVKELLLFLSVNFGQVIDPSSFLSTFSFVVTLFERGTSVRPNIVSNLFFCA